jgi:hypothetical protein
MQAFFVLKTKPVTINYLHVNWDVKMLLAKIKDGKGKEWPKIDQEKFAHNNPAKIPLTGYFSRSVRTVI